MQGNDGKRWEVSIVTEAERLRAELSLAEHLLQAEMNHLEELAEKRRLIADGIAEIEAPSEMWEQYIDEVDGAIGMARARIEALASLRDETRMRLDGVQ